MKQATRIATLASAIVLFVSAALAGPEARAADGPTPYPHRPEEWPGVGVTRVFGWMNDNRKFFWSEREKKQGAIVFAGDSLTGNWKTLGKDFPDAKVANRGIG